MNIWLQIAAIPSTVTIIVNHGIIPLAKLLGITLYKPFNCAFCLSFWLALCIFVLQYGAEGALYASISTAIAAQIKWT
jgi:hypothetical protein